jgi:hypothetical protein
MITISFPKTDDQGQTLASIIETAMTAKGFRSRNSFAIVLAQKTGNTSHAELNALSSVLNGKVSRIQFPRLQAYAHVLGIEEATLKPFEDIDSTSGTVYVRLDDESNVRMVLEQLIEKEGPVSAHELVQALQVLVEK